MATMTLHHSAVATSLGWVAFVSRGAAADRQRPARARQSRTTTQAFASSLVARDPRQLRIECQGP